MIMIVIAASAFLVRFVSGRIISISCVQNASYASVTLRLISAAVENYARDKNGVYPTDFSLLTESRPAYLDKDYVMKSPLKGYVYSCPDLNPSGYRCAASPVKCALTGNTIYSVSTGGLLAAQECSARGG